jgi:glycosyltransferase involved in cell wall biosynthesis
MNKENLFVSAIVPVYNGEKFLAEAINNIQQQNYQPLEIIVVDDGSTDRTPLIAREFQDLIHYIYSANKGPSGARNLGIKIAKGNVIAFLDVDDLWSPNKLQKQISYLASNPCLDIVQGLIQQMKLARPLVDEKKMDFQISSSPYHFLNLGSAIYRKSVFEKVGLFDENFRHNEDTEWFFRAWKNNINKLVIDEVTLYYRQHNNNMTLEPKSTVYFGILKILKKHLDAERNLPQSKRLKTKDLPNFVDYIGKPLNVN